MHKKKIQKKNCLSATRSQMINNIRINVYTFDYIIVGCKSYSVIAKQFKRAITKCEMSCTHANGVCVSTQIQRKSKRYNCQNRENLFDSKTPSQRNEWQSDCGLASYSFFVVVVQYFVLVLCSVWFLCCCR